MSRPPFGDPGVCPRIAFYSSTTNQSPIGGHFSTASFRLKLERISTNGVLTTNLTWVPYWAPFNSGFVNARYVVLASTNVGDLTLPTEFKFEVNDPSGGGQMEVFRTVHGKAHSVSSYCPKKDLNFAFPGEIHVADERVRTNPDMRGTPAYQSARWLTTNEAMALIEGRKLPSPQKLAMAKPKPRPWWQGPVAVGALLVPGGVVWWRLRRAKAAKPGGAA